MNKTSAMHKHSLQIKVTHELILWALYSLSKTAFIIRYVNWPCQHLDNKSIVTASNKAAMALICVQKLQPKVQILAKVSIVLRDSPK